MVSMHVYAYMHGYSGTSYQYIQTLYNVETILLIFPPPPPISFPPFRACGAGDGGSNGGGGHWNKQTSQRLYLTQNRKLSENIRHKITAMPSTSFLSMFSIAATAA